jgi:hypothetical protein
MIEIDDDQYLRRKQLADAFQTRGYPCTEKSLATRACRGNGPPYQLWGGRIPIYPWGNARAWAEANLSTLQCSTYEADLQCRLECRQIASAAVDDARGSAEATS